MQHYQRDKYGSESVGFRWLMWESISLNGGCYEGDDSMVVRRGVNSCKFLLPSEGPHDVRGSASARSEP